MKYFSRLNIYKASNVQYNPETRQAHSYDWWCFVKPVNGMIVFNNHSYSNSTCKHQSKVRGLLADLGINIDLFVDTRCSLTDPNWLNDAIDTLYQANNELLRLINKKGTRATTNERRRLEIEENVQQIGRLHELQMEQAS